MDWALSSSLSFLFTIFVISCDFYFLFTSSWSFSAQKIYAIAFIRMTTSKQQKNILIDVFVRILFYPIDSYLALYVCVWIDLLVHTNDCDQLWLRRNEELTMINLCEPKKTKSSSIHFIRSFVYHASMCFFFYEFVDRSQKEKKIKTFRNDQIWFN